MLITKRPWEGLREIRIIPPPRPFVLLYIFSFNCEIFLIVLLYPEKLSVLETESEIIGMTAE